MNFPSQPLAIAKDYRGIPSIDGIERFIGKQQAGEIAQLPLLTLPSVKCTEANAKIDVSLALDLERSCIRTEVGYQITPDQRGSGRIRKIGGVALVVDTTVTPTYFIDNFGFPLARYDTFSDNMIADGLMDRASRLSTFVKEGHLLQNLPGIANMIDNRNGRTYVAFYAAASPNPDNCWARLHYIDGTEEPRFMNELTALAEGPSLTEFFELSRTLAQ